MVHPFVVVLSFIIGALLFGIIGFFMGRNTGFEDAKLILGEKPEPKIIVIVEECIKCGCDTRKTMRAHTDDGTICGDCINKMGGLTSFRLVNFKKGWK